MFEWLSRFRLAVLEFDLEVKDTLILPAFKGSTLRGAFGHVFRRITCVNRTKDAKECSDCSLSQVCPYHYVFESSPMWGSSEELEGPLSNYEDIPRPFVIEPPSDTREVYEPGESLVFRVILIGNGIEFFPYFIVTFRELGEDGIGKDRRRGIGRFCLKRVKGVTPSEEHLLYDGQEGKVYNVKQFWFSAEEAYHHWLRSNYEAPSEAGQTNAMGKRSDNVSTVTTGRDKTGQTTAEGRLIVGFETPCRLKYERHLIDVPEFHILIRNLLRRISALARFHHTFQPDIDFKGVIESSLRVRLIQNRTRWVDWERYSARQSSRMKLGGIMGVAVYQFTNGPVRGVAGLHCLDGSGPGDRQRVTDLASSACKRTSAGGPGVGDGLPTDETDTESLLPFIVLGQYVHVGKNVTFGLGKLRPILDFS